MLSPSRIRRIDILRGAAVLLVVSFHILGGAFGFDDPGFQNGLIRLGANEAIWWLFSPLMLGGSGVALFFVISGYVIHRAFLKSGPDFNWLKFFGRRIWRIYPAYLVFLISFACLKGVDIRSQDFLSHLALLHNFDENTFFGRINGSFWSLAVECQLYALYPLAMLARRQFGAVTTLLLSGFVSAAWIAYACITAEVPLPPAAPEIWASPFALWPTWLLGALIAERHAQGRRLFQPAWPWALAMAVLYLASFAIQPLNVLNFQFAALGWAAFLDAYVFRKDSPNGCGALFAIIGVASYSIYLIHQPLIAPFMEIVRAAGAELSAQRLVLGLLLFLPAISLLGWLSYRAIECRAAGFGLQSLNFFRISRRPI